LAPNDVVAQGIGYVPQGRRVWARSASMSICGWRAGCDGEIRLDVDRIYKDFSRGWPIASATAARSFRR